MVTVCSALWPPEYRATTLKRSERTSTILPLPSSPHCAPTITAVLPVFNFVLHLRTPNIERERPRRFAHNSPLDCKTRSRFGEVEGDEPRTLDFTGWTKSGAMHRRQAAPP